MKTMTPADKLNEMESARGLAICTNFVEKMIIPPTQVDSPPAKLNPNANPTFPPN